MQALIQGRVGLGQAAAIGEGTASAAAQRAADKDRLMAAQLKAVIKAALKAGKAAGKARPSMIRAPPQELLPRRRQWQPEVKKVKRRPSVVTASARSALTHISETLEDPRYRPERIRAVNQVMNDTALRRHSFNDDWRLSVAPTSCTLPSIPSGKAVAQDAAAGPETVRSHATQTTEHHMAALASDTGVASAIFSHMFTAMIELVFNTFLLWGLGLSM